MPWFQYSVRDVQGSLLEGTMEAPSVQEALKLLQMQGWKVVKLAAALAPATSPAVMPQAAPMAPPMAAPVVGAAQKIAAANNWPGPEASALPPGKIVRTKPASYGDLMLFFAQLHSLVRSGIAVPDAISSVAGRVRNRALVQACREMSPRLLRGSALYDEMARFPDLFPPGVVGAVESGEKGGYLADALDMISKQNKAARGFDLFFWWVPLLAINTVLSFWLMNMLAGVVSRGIDVLADKAPDEKIVETGLAERGLGPVGIGLIVLVVALVVWMWAKNQTFTRKFRHSLATKFPIIKKRTKAECLTLFSWHLSRLSKAGLSPFSSYQLAASAVPNIEISRRLSEEGKGMRDSTSYGPLLASSSLMPVEYGGLIATGEQVGRLPEALEEVSQITQKEGEEASRWFQARAGCWGLLVLFGGGLLAFMVVYGTYLNKVFDIIK